MDLMQEIIARAKANKQRIVLPEGTEERKCTETSCYLSRPIESGTFHHSLLPGRNALIICLPATGKPVQGRNRIPVDRRCAISDEPKEKRRKNTPYIRQIFPKPVRQIASDHSPQLPERVESTLPTTINPYQFLMYGQSVRHTG